MKNKKSLGQNWLFDAEALGAIAENAVAGDAKLCVEVGPGLGTLTAHLLRRFEKVIAVELDERLAANLPKSFPGKNLEVVNEDILQFDFGGIGEPFVVAGNIPYYITSPIILRLLEIVPRPAKIVLLVQREVAERATPVKKHENLLSLAIKNRADVFSNLVVTREKFTPPPKVDSQVLVMTPHEPLVDDAALSLAKIGFNAPRKKLIGNLTRGLGMEKARLTEVFGRVGLSPDLRPENLELADWEKLRKEIANA